MSEKTNLLIRHADMCPMCRCFNSIKIDRSFRQQQGFRVAYGYCRECGTRITIREIKKVSIK